MLRTADKHSPYKQVAHCMHSVVQVGVWTIGNLRINDENTNFTQHLLEVLLEVHFFASPCTMIAHSVFSLKLIVFRFELCLISCFNPASCSKFTSFGL